MKFNDLSSPQKNRIKQLDILRGIAIFLVLLFHKHPTGLTRMGWVGVDLFFVLSGFLVSGLLFSEYQKHEKINLGRFFLRRGLKIYPSFYIFLLLTIMLNKTWGHEEAHPIQIASEAFFVQNYGEPIFIHTWTLAVEEHFYILLGICVLALCKYAKNTSDTFKSIPKLCLLIAISALFIRLILAYYQPYDPLQQLHDQQLDIIGSVWQKSYLHKWSQIHLYATHIRLDSLMFGVFIAYLYYFKSRQLSIFMRNNLWIVFIVSCLLISPCIFLKGDNPFVYTFGFSMLYLGFGGLLLFSLSWDKTLPKLVKKVAMPVGTLLAFVGYNSYTIYLWHMPILSKSDGLIHRIYPNGLHYLIESLIYLGVSIGVGVLTAKLIEQPILKLRNRFIPSKN